MQEMRGITMTKRVLETIPEALNIVKEHLRIPEGAEERRYGRIEGWEDGEFYSRQTLSVDDGNAVDIMWVWGEPITSIDISHIKGN